MASESYPQQYELFPSELPQDAFDVDAAAIHIAANAPEVEYEDRTSEAASDQGWGQPMDAEEAPTAEPAGRRRSSPMPDHLRQRVIDYRQKNPDGQRDPANTLRYLRDRGQI